MLEDEKHLWKAMLYDATLLFVGTSLLAILGRGCNPGGEV